MQPVISSTNSVLRHVRPPFGRLEHAAVGVGAPQVPHRADVHRLGIARIDHDGGDLLRRLETEMLPALAAVH
jgi:hypothetical protein